MVVVDMPFMSYQISVEEAVTNAGRLMKEGRANAVKLEGGKSVCPQIKAITQAGIPVVAHLGLTPQSINALGICSFVHMLYINLRPLPLAYRALLFLFSHFHSIFEKFLKIQFHNPALDRKSTRLNSSHTDSSRMPSSS